MLEKVFYRLGLLFFLLMLIIPTTYQIERGVLLLALIAGGLYKALRGKWKMHRSLLIVGFGCVTASLLFILYGLLNDAPGALSVGTVYVLWPLLFLFFMGILNAPTDFVPFIKVIIVSVIIATVMAILLVAEEFGFVGLNIKSILEIQGAEIGSYGGVVEYNLYNMTTVIFGFSFLLALIALPKRLRFLPKFWHRLAQVALVLTLITLLISGRRAFWVIAAMSPLVIFLIYRLAGISNPFRFKSIFYGIVFALIASSTVFSIFELSFEDIVLDIVSGFYFADSSNLSASARVEQFYPLFNGWMESPFIGSGHGASTPDSIRSEKHTWAYELTYLALLFQIGLVGSFIYASALVWMYVTSIRVVRSRPDAAMMLLPLLTGLTCFLIANATNPYLVKFDYLFTIFLPAGVLNAYLLQKSYKCNHRQLERRCPTCRSYYQHHSISS